MTEEPEPQEAGAAAEESTPEPEAEQQIRRLQADLRRRFEASGCLARLTAMAGLFPEAPSECLEEALHRLCDDGIAEVVSLADGSLVFLFPRR